MITKIRKSLSGDFAKILLKYASSQVVGNVLRMIAGFLTVRLVAPDVYGYFNGEGIFLGYLMLAHAGIMNGLNRELPVEQGRKNIDKVYELAALGFWVALLIGIISALILLFFVIKSVLQKEYTDALLHFTYTISAFFLFFNKFYLPILYRTNQDFIKLTRITIYSSIINIVTVLVVWKWADITGLSIRLIILNIIEFLLLYVLRPVKAHPKFSLSATKSLLKTGIPIYIVGHINPLWDTIKNSIIYGLGGSAQFGYYALSGITLGAIGTIPAAFGQVIYPKMAIAYGEGKTAKNVVQIAYKPMLLLFVINCLIAVAGYFLLPLATGWLLPKYNEGINAALWTLFIPVVASFSLLNDYFNVYKKQIYAIWAILSGIAASLIYIYIYYRLNGFDIALFPQSMIVGDIVKNGICYLLIRREIG